jgi:hypothetical protein
VSEATSNMGDAEMKKIKPETTELKAEKREHRD